MRKALKEFKKEYLSIITEEPAKRWIPNDRYFNQIYCYYCATCDTEAYAAFTGTGFFLSTQYLVSYHNMFSSFEEKIALIESVDEIIDKFNNRNQKLDKLFSKGCKCPCCGSALSYEEGYYLLETNEESASYLADYKLNAILDRMFTAMAEIRNKNSKVALDTEVDEFIERCNEASASSIAIPPQGALIDSPEKLATYMSHLLNLETNVYTLRRQLIDLSNKRKSTRLDGAKILRERLQDSITAIDEYDEKSESLKNLDFSNTPAEEVHYGAPPVKPQKPVFKETKPNEPIYATPGFFNKKKVLAENEAKKADFERRLEMYNNKFDAHIQNQRCYMKAMGQYDLDKAAYDAECLRLDEEARKKHEQKIALQMQKRDEELGEISNKIATLNKERETLIKNAEKTPALVLIDEELQKCKDFLSKTIAAKNEMYNLNIVYPKYRDIVAIASFCDYLMSGRVSQLQGADGAYNLYESESRADLIITKLSDVIASLDAIKSNQYMLYQALDQTNKNIEKLNQTMEEAVESLVNLEFQSSETNMRLASIDTKSSAIVHNTAAIAHNTAVTAYYTKKNAEIADAIAFMVALK